jgi:hypothetical protein
MGAMFRILLAALATLSASACARPAGMPDLGTSPNRTITIELPAPSYELFATTRRWRPTDVYLYTVRLTRWNGSAFVDLPTPLVVFLPQKGTPKTLARFANLAQGRRYRATVTAWGNAGGTAASLALNTQSPSIADFDFSAVQDVQDALWRMPGVTLDSVPFSGTAVVTPVGLPSHARTVDLELSTESGNVVFSETYSRTQTMTLLNLKAGVLYTVSLAARRANGQLIDKVSVPLSWNASASQLEQSVTISVPF